MSSGTRKRSLRSELKRAKADVVSRVGVLRAREAFDEHRAGNHDDPHVHRYGCYACLTKVRRAAKER